MSARIDDLFIPEDDGWTLPGFFAATTNLHPDIRFTYRPFTPQERSVVMEKIHSARTTEEAAIVICRTLAARVRTWDAKRRTADGKEQPMPLSMESFARLRYPVWDRFYQVVIAQSGTSDTDPRWGEEDRRLDADAKYEALMGGKATVTAAVEVLEKN